MPFALVIMGVIIVLAFLTVVAVIYFGSKENVTIHGNGENLASVEAWMQRAERVNPPVSDEPAPVKEQDTAAAAAGEDAPESSTAPAASDSGQTVGDLSDEEREAKRQAALERRKARAAKRAESSDS